MHPSPVSERGILLLLLLSDKFPVSSDLFNDDDDDGDDDLPFPLPFSEDDNGNDNNIGSHIHVWLLLC